jgi:hypothetical protein
VIGNKTNSNQKEYVMRKITILLFVSTCSFMYNNNSLSMNNNQKLFVTLNDNTRATLVNNLFLDAILEQNKIVRLYKLNKERINLQKSDCIDQQEINKLELKDIIDNTETQLTELSLSVKIELSKIYTLKLS